MNEGAATSDTEAAPREVTNRPLHFVTLHNSPAVKTSGRSVPSAVFTELITNEPLLLLVFL